MRHGLIKSIAHNFLQTYTSRYSSWHGYWLWGFVIEDHLHLNWDLLARPTGSHYDPLTFARELAVVRFFQQCEKQGASRRIERVELIITASTPPDTLYTRTFGLRLLNMRFVIKVETSGTAIVTECDILVARHDPSLESPSYGTTPLDPIN